MKITLRTIGVLGLLALSVGCSQTPTRQYQRTIRVVESVNGPVAGDVDKYWVEPMYDSVVVPGQLDPKGMYYRPAHRSLYEIRPGRMQPVQYPSKKQEKRDNFIDAGGQN